MQAKTQRRGILGLLVIALTWAPFASAQETGQGGVLGDFLSQVLAIVFGDDPEAIALPEEAPGPPVTEAGPTPPVTG